VNDGSPDDLRQRAANAYLVWPLAVLDLFREPPEATGWSRLHTRQAFVYGIAAGIAYLIVLALPLLLVIAIPGISATAVIWLYALGLLGDIVGALFLFGYSMSLRERTLRGELFAIPLVTPIADRMTQAGRERR
jgi:uncharacterized membrane protein